MSHYNKLVTKLKNRNSLVKALQRCGFRKDQIEVHNEAQHLYGYRGDQRPEKANVIIRRKHVGGAANDIGFEQQADGTYKAIISDYDRGRYNQQWMHKLETNYGVEQARNAFIEHGWDITETTDTKGRVQLVGVCYQ